VTTWFTSDQHFGHRGILKHRPMFATVEEMEREIVGRFNAVVRPDDTVWHLGDFSLEEADMARVLPKLNGRHHLVMGNHDGCHPCHRRAARNQRAYLAAGFEVVLERCLLGDSHLGRVMLCHLPLVGAGDHGPEERYQGWRPTTALLAEIGVTTLLHGHVHADYDARLIDGIACINVGIDVAGFGPLRADAIGFQLRQLQLRAAEGL
jgi:calcineurin-like phosphoesterase family protein